MQDAAVARHVEVLGPGAPEAEQFSDSLEDGRPRLTVVPLDAALPGDEQGGVRESENAVRILCSRRQCPGGPGGPVEVPQDAVSARDPHGGFGGGPHRVVVGGFVDRRQRPHEGHEPRTPPYDEPPRQQFCAGRLAREKHVPRLAVQVGEPQRAGTDQASVQEEEGHAVAPDLNGQVHPVVRGEVTGQVQRASPAGGAHLELLGIEPIELLGGVGDARGFAEVREELHIGPRGEIGPGVDQAGDQALRPGPAEGQPELQLQRRAAPE